MTDEAIIELYFQRNEDALSETAKKYGHYCKAIAYNILHDESDSEECVNDTYLRAWNSIPPKRPSMFKAFLAAITRNLSLDRYDMQNSKKRKGNVIACAVEELSECLPSNESTEAAADGIIITECIDRFLSRLEATDRVIFVRRYWYLLSVKDIARSMELSESQVKMSLFRSRKKLKIQLETEGVIV